MTTPRRLGQIAPAAAPPALTDNIVGVQGLNIDTLWTFSQVFGNVGTVVGGTTASSILTLESTSAAGTTDYIRFLTASQAERVRIDTNGYTTVGGFPNTFGSMIEVVTDATINNHITQIDIGNNPSGNTHFFLKTRGLSPTSQVIVQSGDEVGALDMRASDGTTWREAASTLVQIDGTPGASSMPGRWIFRTSPSGSAAPQEVLRMDSFQQVTIAPSGSQVGYANTFGARLEVACDPTAVSHFDLLAFGNNVSPAVAFFLKTRGTTPSTQTIVQSGDTIGGFGFRGSDGTAFRTAAQMVVVVDGSPGSGSMPGYISLQTTPSGSTSASERLRIDNAGNVQVKSGTLGYGTGVGGTVTQLTSRTTSVTINKICGQITMFSAAGSATPATFTVNNSTVAATDLIKLSVQSATNLYELFVTAVASTSFNITFFTTGGTSTDAPVINFAVFKAVTS